MPTDQLPSFEELEDAHGSPPFLGGHSVPTESIDLTEGLTKNLTGSGSFDAFDTKNDSFHRLLQALPTPALLIEKSQRIVFCNQACARMSANYLRLIGTKFSTLFDTPDRSREVGLLFETVLEQRKSKVKEEKITIEDNALWARMYFRPLRLADSRAVLLLLEDLTLEKRQMLLLNKIHRAKREWEQTVDLVQDSIAIIDAEYKVVRLNKSAARRAGLPVGKAIGQPCFKLFHGKKEPPIICPHAEALASGAEQSVEYFEKHVDAFYAESVLPNHDDAGHTLGCVLVIRDMTEAKRLEEELKRQATYDPLTHLLNRGAILEALNSALESAKRYGYPVSMSICDVDRLKEINDQLGHLAGDRVLTQFSEVIKQELRHADIGGRYGGDEFILIFPHTTSQGAVECVERVRSRLQNVIFRYRSKAFRLTFSAGVVQFMPTVTSVDELINQADQALYEAKQRGRNQVVLFNPSV